MPPRGQGVAARLSVPSGVIRILRFLVVGAVAVAGPALLAAPAGGQARPDEEAWPVVGGDPAHSGTSPGGPPPPYRRAWTARVPGGPVAGPVVADGKVVVVGGTSVVALDLSTGDVAWNAVRSSGPAGPAAIAGDLVVHGSAEGVAASIVARDLDDGRERWRLPTGAPATGGLTADAERVYVGTRAGVVLAVALQDGEQRWRYRAPGRVDTSPALGRGRLVVVAENYGSGEAAVIALDAATGRRAWRFSAEGPDVGASSPAIAGDTVFVGLGNGQMYALDLETGEERWAAPVLATSFSPRAFTPGAVPAAAGDVVAVDVAHVYLLDGATGEESWSFRIADLLLRGGPIVSDGAVLIGDQQGTLSAISLEEGVRLWAARLGAAPVASLAVAADRVVAATLHRERGPVVVLENDPAGEIVREPSDSELSLGPAMINFLAAALAVGAAVVGLFRFVLPMGRPGAQEDGA